MDVSVIIVNWNTCKVTCDCLRSIYAQTATSKSEVIVIDNASTDESVRMIKEKFPQVTLIENSENKGFAAANNQGIRIAQGRYILLLNSDTLILDNAIFKTVAFADTHPEAAVVGCKVLNPDRTLQRTCFMFPSLLNMVLSSTYLYKLFPRSKFFGREQMTWWDRNDIREVDVVTGCFMLVRREAVEQIGLLDERFFMYGEETDWCYRFKQGGWKILFTPSAEIIHLGGASTKQAGSKMALEYVASMLRFFKKHKIWLSYRFACLLLALRFFLRAPYWLGRVVCSKNNRSGNMQRAKNLTVGALRALHGVRT